MTSPNSCGASWNNRRHLFIWTKPANDVLDSIEGQTQSCLSDTPLEMLLPARPSPDRCLPVCAHVIDGMRFRSCSRFGEDQGWQRDSVEVTLGPGWRECKCLW